MTTHRQIAELSQMDPGFYDKVTYTEMLFFVNSAFLEIEFYFTNTAEDELVIRLEDLAQPDPNRRVDWVMTSTADINHILKLLKERVQKAGISLEIRENHVLCFRRGSFKRKIEQNSQQLKNNRDVPLIRKLLRF